MKNIYDSLPTEFKTILENNSDTHTGRLGFWKVQPIYDGLRM